MRSEYDGVKFYAKDDRSVGVELQKAEPILASFDASKDYNDVNELLELFNIQKLIETGIALPSWSETTYKKYADLVGQFSALIGRYFQNIDDSSFVQTLESVDIDYQDDFWELFVKFKVYKNISAEMMGSYLNKPETTLCNLLVYKELVAHYDKEFAEVLRTSDQTAPILISKYLKRNKSAFYLPKSLKADEYEVVFFQYIHSKNAISGDLQLLYKSQSMAECPISDKLRLAAKRAFEKFWQDHFMNAVNCEYEVSISVEQQNVLKKYDGQGTSSHISYDIGWLEESLDYILILYNFRYVFEMIDKQGRSNLVSIKEKITIFESMFSVDGIKFYRYGSVFNMMDELSKMQMDFYYKFLLAHEIYLEDIFKWYFEKYLPDEFGIIGFNINTSLSTATYIEKCRNLVSEMDGILKQFRMFVHDGSIDRELFEMSSEHIVLDKIPSLIENKYAYAITDEIEKEMFLLFSNQTIWESQKSEKEKHMTLFQLLSSKKMQVGSFTARHAAYIEWLAQRGSIEITDSGTIKLVMPRAAILKDLFEHDVLCVYYCNSELPQIKDMVNSGDLKVKSTLFSQPEADYLDYILNKSKFSNGLDLRNKYIHSTYPKNETEQQSDYLQLLKLMVLVISKMNDEFCLWKDNKEETSPISDLKTQQD